MTNPELNDLKIIGGVGLVFVSLAFFGFLTHKTAPAPSHESTTSQYEHCYTINCKPITPVKCQKCNEWFVTYNLATGDCDEECVQTCDEFCVKGTLHQGEIE